MAARSSPPNSRRAFPKSRRLLTGRDYQSVLRGKSKKMRRDGYMLVKSATQSDGRLGFKVGKRQLRRAVDRNRIKRLVREAFRHADATDGHDWVFITHKGIETRLHDASFRRELDKMMSRARAHRQ